MYRCVDIPGVVTRKIPRDLVARDIFGKNVIVKHKCKTCGFEGPASAFPLESKSKRRNSNHVRVQCAPCHNKYKGKINPFKPVVTRTIESFLDHEDLCA